MKEERAILDEADEAALDDEAAGEAEPTPEEDAAAARKRDIVLTEAFNVLSDLSRLTRGEDAPGAARPVERIPAWLRALQGGRE